MNAEQSEKMERISDNIIRCWTRIKAKARAEGRGQTNIEIYAPCLTAGLNALEQFLPTVRGDAVVAEPEIVEDHVFRVEEGGKDCATCGKPFDKHEYN